MKENTARQSVKLEMQKFQSISMEMVASDTIKEPDKAAVNDSTKKQPKSSKKKAKKEIPKITFNEGI